MARKKFQVTEEVLRAWNAYKEQRLIDGVSLWKIAGELADEVGLSQRQTYLWLNPDARTRDLARLRDRHRRQAYEDGSYRTRYHKFYARYCRRHPE